MMKAILKCSAVAFIGAAALQAQNTLSAEAMSDYQAVKANIMKAAEKMPEDNFAFKPTPAVRNFGELIPHVADAQMGICGVVNGEMRRGEAASKTTKADLIAALKASDEYCDAVYSAMTDADGMTIVKSPQGSRSKLGMLNFNVIHDNEMYRTIAVEECRTPGIHIRRCSAYRAQCQRSKWDDYPVIIHRIHLGLNPRQWPIWHSRKQPWRELRPRMKS